MLGRVLAAAWLLAIRLALPAAADDAPRFLVYGGIGAGLDNATVYQGVRTAFLGTLDASGLIADASAGYGAYLYDSAAAPGGFVQGETVFARLLAGYQLIGTRMGGAVLAGADYQRHDLLVEDPHNPVQGSRIGLAIAVDGWAKPWDALLLSGHAGASTAFATISGRIRAGLAVPLWPDLRIGPEAGGFRNEDNWQLRGGGFVDAAIYRGIHLSLSGGYYRGRDDDEGFYAALSGWQKF